MTQLSTAAPAFLPAATHSYLERAAESLRERSRHENFGRQLDAALVALKDLQGPLTARSDAWTQVQEWQDRRGPTEPWLDVALTGMALGLGTVVPPQVPSPLHTSAVVHALASSHTVPAVLKG